MTRRRAILALSLLGAPCLASAETVSRTVGQVTMTADLSQAYPGGIVVARLRSRYGLGTTYAILDGRRVPFVESAQGPRAIVPVPLTAKAGPETLGIEIFARRGRQRIPLDIAIAAHDYPPRTVVIPETRRHLVRSPEATRASRQLLTLVRTESQRALWQGPFRPPVSAEPAASFGSPQTYVGGSPVEYLTDGAFGEQHRGLDYDAPAGTVVQSPAAAVVLFTGYMPVPGNVVVLDHGQGVVSVLSHLSRIDVREGESVEARVPLGLSGDSGVAAGPLVEWRLYIHGIAVDPRVMDGLGN
jgi:murein DD-endopeptidase MepM/ murein hydrolase activator NlpD